MFPAPKFTYMSRYVEELRRNWQNDLSQHVHIHDVLADRDKMIRLSRGDLDGESIFVMDSQGKARRRKAALSFFE